MKLNISLLICFAILCFSSSSALRISHVFDQDVCFLNIEDRGKPIAKTLGYYCKDQNMRLVNRSCYSGECNYGELTNPAGNECMEPCPQGWKANGARCERPDNSARDSYFRKESDCEKAHTHCGKDINGFYGPRCDWSSNITKISWCARKHYVKNSVAAILGRACKEGYERSDDVCYKKCAKGMRAVGDFCVGQCPKGWNQCGKACAKGRSCENLNSNKFFAFMKGVQQVAAKTWPEIRVEFDHLICP